MAKKKEVIITCNATNVKAVIEGLERGMAALAKEEEKLLNVIKQRGYAEDDEKKRLKELEKAMDAMRTNIQKNREEQKKLGEVMKDLAGAKLKDLKKALQEGKAALNNMSARDPKRVQLVNDLKRIQAQIEANTGAIKKQQSAWGSLGTTLKDLVAYMGVFAGFNKLKSLTEGVFRSNLKLSDSLANIRKVSGLSSEAINDLYRNLSKIDTRNTIEMLNQLAYTGAKLGIGQNYGVEGLTGFVKAAEQVQMALGEDMGEKALPELSKMVEVMGLIPKYGVEQSMQKAASAIFQLGATSTATGSNIVEFSKRLMGLANVSRISTQDLLALGSASDAMGLMPEVSATAFNKLFTSIQRQHNLIEQSLGMSKGRIKELYDEGKTMDAIVEIFERMNEKGNLNLLGTIFKDLGSDGARLVNVMATMADRADILRKHLETSRNAFKEGEAVIGEYMIQNQTAAAMVERAANLWAKAFVNPEGVDMVRELATEWYELSKAMTQSDTQMSSLRTSLSAITLIIETLIKLLPFLIRGMMMFGVAAAIRGVITGIMGMVTAIRTATTAQLALNTAMKSNWFLAIASGIAAALSMLYDYSKAAEEAAKREQEREAKLKAAFESSKEAVEKMEKPLKIYKKALEDATLSEKQRAELLKQFKSEYQDYLDYLGIEINSAVDLAKAYAQVVKVMKQKKAYEEREEYRTQQNGENRMSRIEAQAKVEAAARSFGIEGIDKKWLEETQNVRGNGVVTSRGTADVYRELIEKKMGVSGGRLIGSNLSFKYVNGKLVDNNDVVGPGNGVRWKSIGSKELYEAIDSYITSYRAERNMNKEINQMFNAEYKDIDLEKFDIDEFNDRVQRAQWKRKGSLDNEAPDKDAQKALKKEQQAEKKRMKDEMEQAEKDSTAVINAIEEFYRLQESAVEQLVADGKMTREEADKALAYVRNRKDEMLMNARRAIAGKESNFESLRKTMGQDMLRPNDVNSQRALNTVQTIDVQEAAKKLQRFDGSKNVYDLNAGSFTQAMLKNAAQNELNIQRRQAAIQQEVDKILLQYEYVEQAQRKFGDKLVTLGLITDGYDKVVKQLADGTEIVANTRDVQALANKTVKMDPKQFFGVDPNDVEQLRGFMKSIMTTNGTDKESFASIFPNYDKWVDDWNKQTEEGKNVFSDNDKQQYLEQMQAFYKTLIDMDSDYYKALKQNYEQEKREFGERWQAMGWEAQERQENTAFETQDSLRKISGQGENFGQTYGFADEIAEDPEIARIKNRMEWRARELEDLQARNASEELIMEKQNEMLKEAAALAEKVSSEVAERVGKIQTLSEPLNEWGEEVGTMLGEMWQGISRDGKLTFGQMAKNMGIEYAKLTLKMASENLMKKLQQSLFYKQIEIAEMKHQVEMTNIVITGEMARIAAKQTIGSIATGVKTAQDATEITAEGGKATIMTMFGISEGAAKIIGTLGWWGIPLIGVITSLLMGLLSSAKSTAGSESSKANTNTPKVKLASGMLTYDEGNVKRFIGQDGKVYTATEEPQPKDGLVTHPIATTVQGQPALVAENGPEIVVGRETTRAIMMNEPELIKYLANYEKYGGKTGYATARGMATFDSGNVQSVASTQPSDISPQTSDSAEREALRQQMTQMQEVMSGVLYYLQHPVRPKINMYSQGGEDGLYDSMKKATAFMGKYGG